MSTAEEVDRVDRRGGKTCRPPGGGRAASHSYDRHDAVAEEAGVREVQGPWSTPGSTPRSRDEEGMVRVAAGHGEHPGEAEVHTLEGPEVGGEEAEVRALVPEDAEEVEVREMPGHGAARGCRSRSR